MSIDTLPSQDTFRTEVIRGLPEAAGVDRAKKKIFGARAMQIGSLSSGDVRPWKVDATTLGQLESLVNQGNSGVKVRFAHPNMSRDGMGRHLGRATNARIVGEGTNDAYVAVDLQMSSAAERSPNGNLSAHVLDLAEESPDLFGLSIAPLLDDEAMGKIEPDKNGLVPIRIKSLRAIDVVDEPAATSGGLFSLDSDSIADLPAQATAILDTFFDDSSPDVIRGRFDEFLNRYFSEKGHAMPTAEHTEELKVKDARITELEAENAKLSETPPIEKPADEPSVTPVDASLDVKEAAKAELSRRSEISALCKLAKVGDDSRDLMFEAGFSRSEAQDYLKSSGMLSAVNPPIDEGGSDLGENQKTPDEIFGSEYDLHTEVYDRMGLGREDFIASRKLDNVN